jgi:hypothetical protein
MCQQSTGVCMFDVCPVFRCMTVQMASHAIQERKRTDLGQKLILLYLLQQVPFVVPLSSFRHPNDCMHNRLGELTSETLC